MDTPPPGSAKPAEQLDLAKGVLSFRQAAAMGLTSSALPVLLASAIAFFVLYAGYGSWLAVVVMAIFGLSVAATVNYFARQHTVTGGIQSFLGLTNVRWMQPIAAATIILGYVLVVSPANMAIYVGSFLRDIGLPLTGNATFEVILVIGLGLLVAFLATRRVEVSARLVTILGFLCVPFELLVTVAAAIHNGIALDLQFTLSGTTIAGMLTAIPIAISLIVGFEAVASLGVETREPHKNIPRVIVFIVAVTSALLFVWCLLQTHSLVLGTDALTAGASPTAVLAEQGNVQWAKPWVDGLIAVTELMVTLALVSFATRIVATVAQDGYLPRFLADLHPKRRTPDKAIVFLVGLSTLLPIGVFLGGVGTPLEVVSIFLGPIFYLFGVPYVMLSSLVVVRQVHARAFTSPSLYGALMTLLLTIGLFVYNLANLPAGAAGVVNLVVLVVTITLCSAFLLRHRSKARDAAPGR